MRRAADFAGRVDAGERRAASGQPSVQKVKRVDSSKPDLDEGEIVFVIPLNQLGTDLLTVRQPRGQFAGFDLARFRDSFRISIGGSQDAFVSKIAGNNPVPSIASLLPSGTSAGGTDFTLTVAGTNFLVDSVVQWNGANRTTAYPQVARDSR